jgi:cytochrome o ubiquinol oxidase subunit 2
VGAAEKLLLINATIVMLAVVIPVMLLTIAFAWWFRSSNGRAHYRPDWAYSGRIEIVVWLIPVLVIIFLGGIGWISSHDLDPRKSLASGRHPIEIQVVSLDWKWLFIYPESGVASVNELVLPAGVPVTFRLTSASVMNSFFVPQLGSQIYTMAGMETRLNLMASHPGVYQGLSAQFSGEGFSDMRFRAIAIDDAGFARWLDQARAAPLTLDHPDYDALAGRQGTSGVVHYGHVAPGLFDGIVMQQMHMVPEPKTARPTSSIQPRSES